MPEIELRFYEELNDFLPQGQKKRTIQKHLDGKTSVKDVVESVGVPHTEVDLIIVDGVSVDFAHQVTGGERVAVYPVFESVDISPITRLRPDPLRNPRFLVDANLIRLVGILRLLGLDAEYDPGLDDEAIAREAAESRMTVITRDRRLLMRRIVSRGYYVRSQHPPTQAVEVVRRFDLHDQLEPLSRCSRCNGKNSPVSKQEIEHLLLHFTRLSFDEFSRCDQCGHIYWRGAHSDKLDALIRWIRDQASRS